MAVSRIPRIILDGNEESSSYMIREGMRQLGILKGLMSFGNLQQDIRKVEYIDGSRIVCRSCFGEDVVYIYTEKEEEKKLVSKLYVYVTVSDYVTIWDLLTGEVATDICNNDGKVYNYYGESLITFPCHKSELVKWLEGIKDRPTRQVLKDDPENNRDYLSDNHEDIGNENRVEKANVNDPSYSYYFGVSEPCTFTNIVQDIHVDTDPTYPYDYPRKVYNLLEKDTPSSGSIVNCDIEDCDESFYIETDGDLYYSALCIETRDNSVNYLEPYQPRSKQLYLGTFPNPIYIRPGAIPKEIEYSIPVTSPYLNPITMKSSAASFNCTDANGSDNWGHSLIVRSGYAASFSTVLGDLIVDYIPVRELDVNYDSLSDILREGFDFEGNCFSVFLREGVCYASYEWEQQSSLWEGCGSPEHATATCNWCRSHALSILDRVESESNRFGVSWCGSPYDYRNPSEVQTSGWYRVLLRFYMGGFHSGGHSCLQNYNGDSHYCPNKAICDALPEGYTCDATSWSNELKERFSYVQPTIELERPEEYSKDIDTTKYERPEDYSVDKDGTGFCVDKKYSTLCAFPGRSQGYSEEDDKCFPYDGTYVLHTLGKAVEELINNHYEDGSDDQLLVYLYKRST